ncbi:MAG: hemerythrin domain-containing protein [Roseburia sp.]
MYGIDLLYTEHEHVVRFTKYLRHLCEKMLKGEQTDKEKWMDCVCFIKEYADAHHHGKEEEILFAVMLEKLGPIAHKMIQSGMMVEHNLGRYHLQSMEEAIKALGQEPTAAQKLDVMTHALAYVDLLQRHADKENNVLFPFALRSLSPEDLEKINEASKAFEEEGAKKGMGKYVEWLMRVYPDAC